MSWICLILSPGFAQPSLSPRKSQLSPSAMSPEVDPGCYSYTENGCNSHGFWPSQDAKDGFGIEARSLVASELLYKNAWQFHGPPTSSTVFVVSFWACGMRSSVCFHFTNTLKPMEPSHWWPQCADKLLLESISTWHSKVLNQHKPWAVFFQNYLPCQIHSI